MKATTVVLVELFQVKSFSPIFFLVILSIGEIVMDVDFARIMATHFIAIILAKFPP